MHQVYNTNITAQDISSYLLCSSYNADIPRSILIRCSLNNITGGEDYTIYATIQEFGTSVESIIQPLNSYYINTNVKNISFPSILVPMNTGDIIKIYVKGISSDKHVTINTIWFDLSVASASAVENIPLNPLLTNDARIPPMIASASSVENIVGISASTIWEYSDRTLTEEFPEGISASTIWEYNDRTLTEEFPEGISASTIWEYADRTLTEISIDNDAIADAVWNELLSSHSIVGSAGSAISQLLSTDIFQKVIENGYTFEQIIKIMVAVLAGKLSGGTTTTLTFRDLADTVDRLIVTVDDKANRTDITRNV